MENDGFIEISPERLAILDVQRKRSNKISNLMGGYLLKGWRMLSESCNECGTILFMTQEGQIYCVGCSEVDVAENKAVGVLKADGDQSMTTVVNAPLMPAPMHQEKAKCNGFHHASSVTSLLNEQSGHEKSATTLPPCCDFESALFVVQNKLLSCVEQLDGSQSADDVQRWAVTIKTLADTLISLKKCVK